MNLVGESADVQFDEQHCRELGASLHEQYASAEPFPHIVMDDFVSSDFRLCIGNTMVVFNFDVGRPDSLPAFLY